MTSNDTTTNAELIENSEQAIVAEWVGLQKKSGSLKTGRITENELVWQSREFLRLLRDGLAKGHNNVTNPAHGPAKQVLGDFSGSRALQGFSPRETATFIFSLKQPLFKTLDRGAAFSPALATELTWSVTLLLGQLGLYTLEVFQKSREIRQQREIAELSTPVVKLWNGILALPLIGTIDSQRTQVVMESLLQTIVDTKAEIAIIDIISVPTVDTLTAQHLLKTVAAAKLMGARCLHIAQTMVNLGVELSVLSKGPPCRMLSRSR